MKNMKIKNITDRLVCLLPVFAMALILTACGGKAPKPANITGEAIEDKAEGTEETTEVTEVPETDENSDETYILRYYNEDVIYQLDAKGNRIGAYSKEKVSEAFGPDSSYYDDYSLCDLDDGVGYYYTSEYEYSYENDTGSYDYVFYAYDFKSDTLKTIYETSSPAQLHAYDAYKGRLYIYFDQNEEYSKVSFDIDRDNLEFREVTSDDNSLLSAINGMEIRRGSTDHLSYECPEHIMDRLGFLLCSVTDWSDEDCPTEFYKVYPDATSEKLSYIMDDAHYVNYVNKDWLIAVSFGENTSQAININTEKTVDLSEVYAEMSGRPLGLSGDLLYYYSVDDSKAGEGITTDKVFAYDLSKEVSTLTAEASTVPGFGNITPCVEGF
ncbi:MAG: hypothetical protein J6033_01755, partial [Lachnospiraceae bacterium]|nr:hypothetical protein [Lachnospiraceae bacterium]